MFRKFLKSKLQNGQSLVFVAVSLPILFLFVAAAADFGWLYLNQSRLQNAADAAVTAAANVITDKGLDINKRRYSFLVSNYDENFLRLANAKTIYGYNTDYGDQTAKKYAELNLKAFLGDENLEVKDVSSGEENLIPDNFNTVKFKRIVYGADREDDDAIYYVVILSEKLKHLFDIMDNFNIVNLNSKAMAVAKITYHPQYEYYGDPPHGPSLYKQMRVVESDNNYNDWWAIYNKVGDQINQAKTDKDLKKLLNDTYKTLDQMTIARMRSVQAKGNEYVKGNFYRTETLMLMGSSKAVKDGKEVGEELDQRNFNKLFVDLKADLVKKPLKDTDPASTQNAYNLYENSFDQIPANSEVLKYRIHDLINIGKWNGSQYTYEYKVRTDKEPPDNLYVYIENEDAYSDNNGSGSARNTVRQMIINVNAANTDDTDDKYRPMFIFYDGPQKDDGKDQTVWQEKWRETWRHLVKNPDDYEYKEGEEKYDNSYKGNARNSLPVILNLNADFRGVFFMPNSPVVINGNNHSLEGFVVAMKFLKLKEAHDFPIKAVGGNPDNKITDARGNIYYLDDEGCTFYHAAAEGGTRYIHVETILDNNGNPVKDNYGKNKLKCLNVIYATGTFSEAKNPKENIVSKNENVYEVFDEVEKKTKYVTIPKNHSSILYIYTLVEDEKSNLTPTFADRKLEKESVTLNAMYVDQLGNVQYRSLRDSDNYKSSVRPAPNDPSWRAGYTPGTSNYKKGTDETEIIYDKSIFNIRSAKYNSYHTVNLVDYTYLGKNNDNQSLNEDIFYTTIRSDWVD